jgi:hypothetical protein
MASPAATARDGRPEDGLARGHGVDGADDLVLLGTLQHVSAGARAHGGEHRVVVVEHGQHEHRDAGSSTRGRD